MSGPRYERPTSLPEAIALLAGSEGAKPLSGGTDLAVAMRHGDTRPDLIVDLKSVPELASSIEVTGDMVTIAANTVMTDLENDDRIRTILPGLVEAAQVVGSVQIRNRATLAGNLGNASPAADTPPVLMALRAELLASGPAGSRSIPIDEFFLDYRSTAVLPGELITAIRIRLPRGSAGSAFLKLGVRRAMEISVVCVGVAIGIGNDGTISEAGVGLGSVAATTIRASAAEAVLIGAEPSDEVFAAAGEAAGGECRPIDDLRASGAYRAAMVPVLVRRALATAHSRATT